MVAVMLATLGRQAVLVAIEVRLGEDFDALGGVGSLQSRVRRLRLEHFDAGTGPVICLLCDQLRLRTLFLLIG